MSLERFFREQVYYYKRKKMLKEKRRGAGPKGQSSFAIFNASTTRPNRPKKSPSFYGTGGGAKQIAGVVCIILGGILLLTNCFGRDIEETKAEGKRDIANKEVSIEVGQPTAVIAQNASQDIVISKKEQMKGMEGYYQVIQDFEMSAEELEQLFELSMKQQREFAQTLSLWSMNKIEDKSNKEIYKSLKKNEESELITDYGLYEAGVAIYKQFVYDIKYFPIAKHKDYTFEEDWKTNSLFEGNKVHYGVDIIDPKNSTGKIPIVSMTDGVVENIGWNDTGGYRVGIRSTGGAYFYYAHLHELPLHLKKGDTILAGDFIGLMGNTGYGAEGTNGKVPVHLHIGIAVKSAEGKEFWLNPYPLLEYIEQEKIEVKSRD